MTFNSIPINDLLESELEDDGMTFAIGAENNKLSSIFSTSLNFGAGKGNGIYYLDNGEQKFLTTEVIKEVNALPEDICIPEKEVSTIPVTGEIKTIKIDTSKTKEEVLAILGQLTYQREGMDGFHGIYSPASWYTLDQTSSDVISTINGDALVIYDYSLFGKYNSNSGSGYVKIAYEEIRGGKLTTNIIIFTSLETHEFASNGGWNPDFTGEIALTNFTTTGRGFNSFSEEERLVGNEILKDFMTAVLPGVNKKADKQEDIFYKVVNGTVVPNSGHIDKLYLNTALSTEEVVEILSKLQFHNIDETKAYCIAFCENKDIAILVMEMDGIYAIIDYLSDDEAIYFVSTDIGLGFTG
jgi:hypothetical protein